MDQGYNLDNLEASFREYLVAGNVKPVSIKNYLSDLRHFLGWLTFVIASAAKQSQSKEIATSSPLAPPRNDIIDFLNFETINEYKSYLTENNIPVKTVNRRLSTLRKFCSFCIAQGWTKENPAKRVGNVIAQEIASPLKADRDDILQQFQQDLQKENLDQQTIKSYLDDVQEFLSV